MSLAREILESRVRAEQSSIRSNQKAIDDAKGRAKELASREKLADGRIERFLRQIEIERAALSEARARAESAVTDRQADIVRSTERIAELTLSLESLV